MKRFVKRGEILALKIDALRHDGKAIWWDNSQDVPQNETVGCAEVVSIRGSLEHHKTHGCDSYEGIYERTCKAFEGCKWDPEACDYVEGDAPDYVILRIDSPGGVVSGLNETVFALRRLSAEHGIPLVAFVDELAASAAYALACAASEIFLPKSAIAGSVGVISTMYDQVAADKAMGINFVTLTSGARKADGHPHVPVSEAAINVEQRRVDRLAKQFFRLVADVRPVTPKDLESYQAGIFLADQAVARGLADAVMGWDEVVSLLNDPASVNGKGVDAPRQKASKVETTGPAQSARKESTMLQLRALIKTTTSKLETEKDPKKRQALTASLVNFKATLEAMKKEKHVIEKYESEESDEEEDEAEEEESEESEESEAKKSEEESEAKGNETDRKGDSDGDDDDHDDDDKGDDKGDDEAKKATKASLIAIAREATGKTGRAAVGALAAKLAAGERALAMVEKIASERRAEQKATMIAEASNARAITKSEANTLRGKPMSFVKSFIDMRRDKRGALKAIVNVGDDTILIPDPNVKPGTGAALSESVMRIITAAVAAAPEGVDRAKLRADMIADHEKRAMNGAQGRY
jgi:ClpP class serine protease